MFHFIAGRKWVFALGLLTCFVAGPMGCDKKQTPSKTQSTIRIGEVTTLSGIEASFGTSAHRGIQLAIEEINTAGGINGRQIELITLDDRGSAEEATSAATKLLSIYKVNALTGALPSSRGIAIAPIAQKFGIPLVSSASTHPAVTQFGDSIFRICFIDPFQGHVMAKFALEYLKIRKIALLKDIKSDYSVGLSDFFTTTFKQGGGMIATLQSYSSGDIDYKSQLTAIRAQNPQAIFAPGYYTDIALMVRQARELGMTMPILGGDGLDSPQFLKIGGKALNNTYYSTHYSSDDRSPTVQSFVSHFKARFSESPDGLAALGYDGILVLAEAMRRAPNMDSKEIRSALANTQHFSGVTGRIQFDQNRNPIKSAVVLKIENEKIRYVTTVAP